MKSLVIALIALGVGITGTIFYFSRHQAPPVAPVVEQAPPAATANPAPPVEKTLAPQEPPKVVSEKAAEPAPASPAVPAPAASDRPAIAKSVDALLGAKSAAEKHDLFQQLVQSGQIDAAIAELKQRAADNPNDAALPTTLGEAQLNKVRALRENGGDVNEMGILAMQADQSFNAALKIDPQNWEAQFVKASSMYYWPANPERDNDVVQRLSGLIDQQETMSMQPQFARTYELLGNQYQKLGQTDKAMATWQLGSQKFPGDPALRKKISGQ